MPTKVDPTALAGGGISRVTGLPFQLNPTDADPGIEPTPIPEPQLDLSDPVQPQTPSIEVTGSSPNISPAISDYWNAVDQYGYGNFGYDAQGNISPYPQGEPTVDTGAGASPSDRGISGQSPSVEVTGASPNVNPAISDYWNAVGQYGQGNFGYDSQGNVVPYSAGTPDLGPPGTLIQSTSTDPTSQSGDSIWGAPTGVVGPQPDANQMGGQGMFSGSSLDPAYLRPASYVPRTMGLNRFGKPGGGGGTLGGLPGGTPKYF